MHVLSIFEGNLSGEIQAPRGEQQRVQELTKVIISCMPNLQKICTKCFGKLSPCNEGVVFDESLNCACCA